MRNWTIIAGGLSLVMGIQAMACTQPTSESLGTDEAALQASVTVGGRRFAPPVVTSKMVETGMATIRAQSQPGDRETWVETEGGRRVVILQQSLVGNTISARGYFVDPGGEQVPFELVNFAPSISAGEASELKPKWLLAAIFVVAIIVVVVVVVAPPIVNSVQCSNRSTDQCLCQKALPEPSACTVSGEQTEAGVEACMKVEKNETKCICRPRTPGSGAACGELSDP